MTGMHAYRAAASVGRQSCYRPVAQPVLPQRTCIAGPRQHQTCSHVARSMHKCSATGSGGSGEVTRSMAEVEEDEEVFYQGRGAPAELIVSLLLGATLLYLPLTAQSIGRRLWISYKFTNKRLIVSNTSPLFSKEVQVLYGNVREVRAAPRAFGLWGDMVRPAVHVLHVFIIRMWVYLVIFLKDGSRLELLGVEDHQKLKKFVERQLI